MAKNLMAAKQYEKYRKTNLDNKFIPKKYVFFPQHFLDLNYQYNNTLKSTISQVESRKKWSSLIKKQRKLEDKVIVAFAKQTDVNLNKNDLNLVLNDINEKISGFKTTYEADCDNAQMKIAEELASLLEDFLGEVILTPGISSTRAMGLFKRKINQEGQTIKAILKQLEKKIQEYDPDGGQSRITYNVLQKVMSYGFLAEEDTRSLARAREKSNIFNKNYTVEQIFKSIQDSVKGTLNNLLSHTDEESLRRFCIESLKLNGVTVGNRVQNINSSSPSSLKINLDMKHFKRKGRLAKADVKFQIDIQNEKKAGAKLKPLKVGISNKLGKGDLKIHSAGNFYSLLNWIKGYKETQKIVGVLESKEFQFALANELNSSTKGGAWDTLQSIVNSTIHIWLGNEFLMKDTQHAQAMFGKKAGNFNIAFLMKNGRLARLSSIYEHFIEQDFTSGAYLADNTATAGDSFSKKNEIISNLPKLSGKDIFPGGENYPYPNNLMSAGSAVSEDLLSRISYTVSLKKNLL